jgi:phage shock protein C
MAATTKGCPRCQREAAPDARFCAACGARLSGSPRVLRRHREHAQLAGVCAGLADYFDLDPTLVRALYAVVTFFTGILPGIILYIVLTLLVKPA